MFSKVRGGEPGILPRESLGASLLHKDPCEGYPLSTTPLEKNVPIKKSFLNTEKNLLNRKMLLKKECDPIKNMCYMKTLKKLFRFPIKKCLVSY